MDRKTFAIIIVALSLLTIVAIFYVNNLMAMRPSVTPTMVPTQKPYSQPSSHAFPANSSPIASLKPSVTAIPPATLTPRPPEAAPTSRPKSTDNPTTSGPTAMPRGTPMTPMAAWKPTKAAPSMSWDNVLF